MIYCSGYRLYIRFAWCRGFSRGLLTMAPGIKKPLHTQYIRAQSNQNI